MGLDGVAEVTKKSKKRKAKPAEEDAPSSKKQGAGPSPQRKKSLPPHRYILAPMVGGSELAFRLLCRRYATPELLCYTPMMDSGRFVVDAKYRQEIFQTSPADRPLVAHFSGNKPDEMLAAAKLVEKSVDAVDLNLGCPQRIAHSGHFGSFLLDEEDRPLVCSIVRALAGGLSVPVFVKIRILSTREETIRLVTQLRDAGAALVAIHARHRVNLVGRSGPGARDGPALLDEVTAVRQAVQGLPIIANGNVTCWDDVVANLEQTAADGVMSAEGLLDDPTLFLPTRQLAGGGGGSGGCGGANRFGGSGGAGGASGGGADGAMGGATEEQKAVKRLEKKLRQIEALEARESDGLSAEEKQKVEQKKVREMSHGRSVRRKETEEVRAVACGPYHDALYRDHTVTTPRLHRDDIAITPSPGASKGAEEPQGRRRRRRRRSCRRTAQACRAEASTGDGRTDGGCPVDGTGAAAAGAGVPRSCRVDRRNTQVRGVPCAADGQGRAAQV